jgi:hypothetical protein
LLSDVLGWNIKHEREEEDEHEEEREGQIVSVQLVKTKSQSDVKLRKLQPLLATVLQPCGYIVCDSRYLESRLAF